MSKPVIDGPKQTPNRRRGFCGEGIACQYGLCNVCQNCEKCYFEEMCDEN